MRQGQQDADADDNAARDEPTGGKGQRVHRALAEHHAQYRAAYLEV